MWPWGYWELDKMQLNKGESINQGDLTSLISKNTNLSQKEIEKVVSSTMGGYLLQELPEKLQGEMIKKAERESKCA